VSYILFAIFPPTQVLHSLIAWLVEVVGTLGYPGIIILMALESSFFPFPSEVVMIPAGYLAYNGEMNIVLVIVFGILGSILGALFNYYLAIKLGRPALHKWGKWLFLPEHRFLQVELFFKSHGEISTFIGRLIPGIRQYISFPAGLSRMNLTHFIFWTSAGAGIWMTILALIGYFVGGNEELVTEWSKTATFWIIIICVGIVGIYWKLKKK
jgi:membrane protein DedA with SNARE-associated domain